MSVRALAPTHPVAAVALAAAGGLLTWLAFPSHDLWFLLPVGLAALLAALLVERAVIAAASGLAWGLAFFLPLTTWASIYAGLIPWVALGVVEALYIVVFALMARAVLVRRGLSWSTAVVVPCLWAGVETLRSHAPWGGLPWGATGFALQSSPLLNLAPWVGMPGLAVVVAWLALLLLAGASRLLGRRAGGSSASGLWPIAIGLAAVLGCVVIPSPHNPAPEGDAVMRIAGIQGGAPRVAAQSLEMPEEMFPNSLDVTADVAERSRAEGAPVDLVVWPEASAGWDPREDAARGDAISAAARDADAPVLIGAAATAPGGRIFNMAMLWRDDGSAGQTYAKRHPVPFGEYIPARSFFRHLSDKVDLVAVDMAPGDRVGTMEVGERTVGVLICFEIAYDNLMQDAVRGGADVIVVPTNTVLFGDSDEAAQQLGEARVMAAISGRSIVQVASVGESAIVTPDGRILEHVGHWEQGDVTADVPLRTGITPAIAAGPWIAVVTAALGLAGWLLSVGSRTSARTPALTPRPTRTPR